MKALLTVFCLLLAATIIDVNSCEAVRPTGGAFSEFQTTKKPAAPHRIRQASKLGLTDAAKFRKRRPSGLWSSFRQGTKSFNQDWPSYLRKAYVNSARKGFQSTPPSRFYRP